MTRISSANKYKNNKGIVDSSVIFYLAEYWPCHRWDQLQDFSKTVCPKFALKTFDGDRCCLPTTPIYLCSTYSKPRHTVNQSQRTYTMKPANVGSTGMTLLIIPCSVTALWILYFFSFEISGHISFFFFSLNSKVNFKLLTTIAMFGTCLSLATKRKYIFLIIYLRILIKVYLLASARIYALNPFPLSISVSAGFLSPLFIERPQLVDKHCMLFFSVLRPLEGAVLWLKA